MASSVSFMRRLSSILSSSVPRMRAMARCSDRGGYATSRDLAYTCAMNCIAEPGIGQMEVSFVIQKRNSVSTSGAFDQNLMVFLIQDHYPLANHVRPHCEPIALR